MRWRWSSHARGAPACGGGAPRGKGDGRPRPGQAQAALGVPFAKKPTPKTAPTAIWVELTGRPSQLATITVSAADSATQKARIGFSLVIWLPTMRISFGAEQEQAEADAEGAGSASPNSGMATSWVKSPVCVGLHDGGQRPTALDVIGAMGKLSSAAETTSGIANRTFSDLLRLSSPCDCRRMTGIITSQGADADDQPQQRRRPQRDMDQVLQPFSAR